MIFITGGCCQSKRSFAKKKFSLSDKDFTDGGACTFESAFSRRALCHFELFAARAARSGRDPIRLLEAGVTLNSGIIIIADEIGSGIVPEDKQLRADREAAGRAACAAAGLADTVYRVCCGIPMLIKGAVLF